MPIRRFFIIQKRISKTIFVLLFFGFLFIPGIAGASATTSPKSIGFFCNPYISTFIEGEYYEPTFYTPSRYDFPLICTFQSPELDIPFRVRKHGVLFRGTVGSSTIESSHSLVNGPSHTQLVEIKNPVQGENILVAILQARSNTNDGLDFMSFFMDGAVSPPHNNFGFINWKYGTSTPALPEIDPVIIIPGLMGSARKNGVWVMDPILHTYDNLIETLKANGYVEGKDLFLFPYDWRRSNVDTAKDLKIRIDQIENICECDTVDIVAHSMGGLVARQYVQSDMYENNVDQLIFLGTPHNGAPKAYLLWEAGENDVDRENRRLSLRLSLEARINGHSNLFNYIHSYPITSLSEILPVYDYLKNKDSDVLRTYHDNYPQNVFLENLADTEDLLRSRTSVLNITGNNAEDNTISSYEVASSDELPFWEHGEPNGFTTENILTGNVPGIVRGFGDGTVPEAGSLLSGVSALELPANHGRLPTEGEEEIYKELTGNDPETVFKEPLSLNLGFLYIQLLSPADFQIIAPDGKKIGKNFETREEFDEIPGAFYSGFLEHDEYVTIPNPLSGEYKIVVQGTGDGGAYTVVSSYISLNGDATTEFEATTTPERITALNLVLNTENPEENEIIPEDATPPIIQILSPETKDYTRHDVLPLSVHVFDEESGISTTRITLDGIIKSDGDEVDLFFEHLGSHLLEVEAVDNVGNRATSSVEFRLTTTPDTIISDIEHAHTLGWITQEKTKNQLIKKVERAIQLEKRIEKFEKLLPNGKRVVKRIERLEKRINRILGKQILRDLERERGKTMNEQAYQLLKEDIGWLLNN